MAGVGRSVLGCGVSILGFNIFFRNYSLSKQLPNTKIAHYIIFWYFLAAASIEVGQRKKSSAPKSKKNASSKHNKCGYY